MLSVSLSLVMFTLCLYCTTTNLSKRLSFLSVSREINVSLNWKIIKYCMPRGTLFRLQHAPLLRLSLYSMYTTFFFFSDPIIGEHLQWNQGSVFRGPLLPILPWPFSLGVTSILQYYPLLNPSFRQKGHKRDLRELRLKLPSKKNFSFPIMS